MPDLEKKEWLLLFLREKPLDRIRLMKALFLLWHRGGRRIQGFYEFVPYMYGPCSFDLYRELASAEHNQLVSQAPHPVARWAPYYLTARGANAAANVAKKVDSHLLDSLRSIATEVASAGFQELLNRVYTEAPDFASQSVVIQGLRS